MNAYASMKESRELLRQRFQAETDIEIANHSGDWGKYARWIEKLAISKLNRELVRENEVLRSWMQIAMKALEQGIAGAHEKRKRSRVRYKRKVAA